MAGIYIYISWSQCLYDLYDMYVCLVCLYANQDGTNRNRCTRILVILYAQIN